MQVMSLYRRSSTGQPLHEQQSQLHSQYQNQALLCQAATQGLQLHHCQDYAHSLMIESRTMQEPMSGCQHLTETSRVGDSTSLALLSQYQPLVLHHSQQPQTQTNDKVDQKQQLSKQRFRSVKALSDAIEGSTPASGTAITTRRVPTQSSLSSLSASLSLSLSPPTLKASPKHHQFSRATQDSNQTNQPPSSRSSLLSAATNATVTRNDGGGGSGSASMSPASELAATISHIGTGAVIAGPDQKQQCSEDNDSNEDGNSSAHARKQPKPISRTLSSITASDLKFVNDNCGDFVSVPPFAATTIQRAYIASSEALAATPSRLSAFNSTACLSNQQTATSQQYQNHISNATNHSSVQAPQLSQRRVSPQALLAASPCKSDTSNHCNINASNGQSAHLKQQHQHPNQGSSQLPQHQPQFNSFNRPASNKTAKVANNSSSRRFVSRHSLNNASMTLRSLSSHYGKSISSSMFAVDQMDLLCNAPAGGNNYSNLHHQHRYNAQQQQQQNQQLKAGSKPKTDAHHSSLALQLGQKTVFPQNLSNCLSAATSLLNCHQQQPMQYQQQQQISNNNSMEAQQMHMRQQIEIAPVQHSNYLPVQQQPQEQATTRHTKSLNYSDIAKQLSLTAKYTAFRRLPMQADARAVSQRQQHRFAAKGHKSIDSSVDCSDARRPRDGASFKRGVTEAGELANQSQIEQASLMSDSDWQEAQQEHRQSSLAGCSELVGDGVGDNCSTRFDACTLASISIDLLKTYKGINELYYLKKEEANQEKQQPQLQQQQQSQLRKLAKQTEQIELVAGSSAENCLTNVLMQQTATSQSTQQEHLAVAGSANLIGLTNKDLFISNGRSGAFCGVQPKRGSSAAHQLSAKTLQPRALQRSTAPPQSIQLHTQQLQQRRAPNCIMQQRNRRPAHVQPANSGNALQAYCDELAGTYMNFDDANSDLIVTQGELFANRYEIRARVGKGAFGQVLRAFDHVERCDVAIKIIKSKKLYVEQSRNEVSLLQLIEHYKCDPNFEQFTGRNNIVNLKSHFVWHNHLCIVLELLSYNLYDLLTNTRYVGVSLKLARKFAYQILSALVFLSKPQLNIIHCDLKPENILLCNPRRSTIKIVDFGSSCHFGAPFFNYIQSRFYRSIEVIIGASYTAAIDIWSVGCILFEMHTGKPLFNGTNEFDQLNKIVETLGIPPASLLDRGVKTCQFFVRRPTTKAGSNQYSLRKRPDSKTVYMPPGARKLHHILDIGTRNRDFGEIEYSNFLDLLLKMLEFEPTLRLKPEQALAHPFFTQQALGASDY